MQRAMATTAAAVLVLVLAACGSDDGGGTAAAAESNEYVEVLAAEMLADPDAPFDQSQAECLAREVIDAIGGVELFEDAGVTPQDLAEADGDGGVLAQAGVEEPSDDQIHDAGAAFGNCDIGIVDLMGDDADKLSQEAIDCLDEAVTDEVMGEIFLVADNDDEEMVDDIVFEAITPCLPLLAQ